MCHGRCFGRLGAGTGHLRKHAVRGLADAPELFQRYDSINAFLTFHAYADHDAVGSNPMDSP